MDENATQMAFSDDGDEMETFGTVRPARRKNAGVKLPNLSSIERDRKMKKKPPIGKRGRASSTPVSVQSKVRLRPSLPPLPVSLYPPPLCNTLLHVPSMLIRVWGNPQGRSPELCYIIPAERMKLRYDARCCMSSTAPSHVCGVHVPNPTRASIHPM